MHIFEHKITCRISCQKFRQLYQKKREKKQLMKAHIVYSSIWSTLFVQSNTVQIEKAWNFHLPSTQAIQRCQVYAIQTTRLWRMCTITTPDQQRTEQSSVENKSPNKVEQSRQKSSSSSHHESSNCTYCKNSSMVVCFYEHSTILLSCEAVN